MLHIYFYLIKSNFYACFLFLCIFSVIFLQYLGSFCGFFLLLFLYKGLGTIFFFASLYVCFRDPSSSVASLDALISFSFCYSIYLLYI